MSKHLIYVVALALSIAVAACVTQSQPTQVGRTSILAADALQRGKAAYDRRDYMKAFREWLPLAQQGNAFAQHYLGVLYAEGLGVTKDEGEAVRWYRLAAAQGFIQAYYNLGIMYEHGRGVPRDLVEAHTWYAKAAEFSYQGREARNYVARQLAANQAPTPTPSSVTPPAPVSVSPAPPAALSSPTETPQRAKDIPSPTSPIQQSISALRERGAVTENIPLIKKGGVYQLPVEINGVITLHFILDTGATDVLLPVDVARTLLRTGTIKETDFLPGAAYTLADGSAVNNLRFLLRSLTIGNRRVTNVAASIGPVSSPLLLGQSFLEKLGTWGIDSQRQVLTFGTLDVRFISSLPVMQGNVYKAWGDSKPVQIVRAGD